MNQLVVSDRECTGHGMGEWNMSKFSAQITIYLDVRANYHISQSNCFMSNSMDN